MERLTERERNVDGTGVAKEEITDGLLKPFADKILTKLADYEDSEEQGLLVILPCPIGTTVWDIFRMEIREITVTSIEYNDNKEYVLWAGEDELLGTLNEAVFLTREEAEKKLEEIQNDKT